MPYTKQVQRVIGGGLDYRNRPTELPDDGAQKMVNCALDQLNSVRSRKGHELICTASGSVQQMIHALSSRWQSTGTTKHLVGFKKYVWANGNGTADKDCSTVISTAGMRKSKGSEDWRWIPEAPTAAPTIATNASVITVIDDFSDGWTQDTGSEDPDADPPPDPEFDSNGLFVQGEDDTTFSFSKSVSMNLYDGFDKDDLFRIRLRAKKWSHIAGVSFEVDVGDGSFKNDFYKARIPLKEILAGRKETVTFYLRKRPLSPDDAAANKNLWGFFERVGQTTDSDWRSVVRLRVKVEFTLATRFWFSHWEMVGNEDNTLEGDDFGVYYTRTTADGHESNPSPKSKLVHVNHGSINVTDLVQGGDPQVTGMNIYLTGGTLGAVYRANGAKLDPDTGDPVDGDDPITGSSYTITASADDLTNLNIQMEDDHDDPPEAEGIAGPYFGRILAWKGTRFYWTHQNKPYAFANPDGPDGDWADIDENAGNIKHISIRPFEAWIYGENDVFVLQGDPGDSDGVVHTTNVKMGTPSRNGVAQAGPADIAYLGTGIYVVDTSGAPRKISAKIEPVFQGRTTLLWDGTQVQPISDPSTVCVGFEDGIVRVSHSGGTFCYSIALDRWVSDSRLFTCFQSEGEARILGGQSSGKVLKLETGDTDAGSPITFDFLSKAYDCGIIDNEKRAEDLTTFHDTGGQSLTQSLYYAEQLATSTTISSSVRERTVQKLGLFVPGDGIRARNFAVQITGSVSTPVFIEGIAINYYPEAREGKAYDTGVVMIGEGHTCIVRELQAEIENAAELTLRLQTDLPGFGLATRETHTIGTNLFRRTEPIVMTDEVYGHNLRVAISGTGYFHPWGLRALCQVVGTYLHGAKGEYYLSDPLDFGSERVKMIREVEVVYRTLGTMTTLDIYSDLPGNAIGLQGTVSLPATTTEQSIKVRVSGYYRGRLFQFKITPQGGDLGVDCRIEAIRVRMKMIGEPHATAWTWVDLPLAKTADAIWVPLTFTPQDAVA